MIKFNNPEQIIKIALRDAVNMYGKKATTEEVIFYGYHDDSPQTFLPGNGFDKLGIKLSLSAKQGKDNWIQASYQISHEVFHCLMPVKFGSANYMEEGCAVYNSFKFINKYYGNNGAKYLLGNPKGKYKEALQLVKYCKIDERIIKNLRNEELYFSKLDEKILSNHLPEHHKLFETLLLKFQDSNYL